MTPEPTDEAGSVEAHLTPATVEGGVGASIAIEIVVEDSWDIGSHESSLELADSDVAVFTGAELLGDPGSVDVDIAEDGDIIELTAALMDVDPGPVPIARVDVELTEAGTTDLDLTIDVLTDEEGDEYEITETAGATLEAIDELSLEIESQITAPDSTVTFPVDVILADEFRLSKLWTDWDVDVDDTAGALRPDDEAADELELSWENPAPLANPEIEIELPERYVGGTYLLEYTAANTVAGTVESDTVQLLIDEEFADKKSEDNPE